MAIIFIFFITNKGYAQSVNTSRSDSAFHAKDSVTMNVRDTTIALDSVQKDSTKVAQDTSKASCLERQLGIKISRDALASTVNATAEDSVVMNMKTNLFYLYGKAKVDYEDLKLGAGQVTYRQSTSIITASPYEDGKEKDSSNARVTFEQGKEKFTSDSMQYNFKSKRAIIRNVHSQYGEGYVFSEQIKRNPDQTVFGLHSIYTTCALDTPHFGINAKKIKVIPGKLIVSGPCNITIEGVPTPLWLPFGLFPISTKQKSGFVLPTYTIEEQRGLGLLNGGYYAYLSDHADLLTQANIYTKGSYALSELSSYNSLYHYSGLVSLSYNYNKTGEDFEQGASTQKDFMLNWRHQSDAKAIPGQSFNASVQVGTSSFYSNNSYDPNQILNNQYQSNITYSKNWQGTPFGLTISALHSQNTGTHEVNVTLPSINFHVTQINPFQNKKRVGNKWYDKITASYTVDLLNRTTFYDTLFHTYLSNLSLSNFQSGVHHSVPISASYTIFRYVNMSFNVNYDEYLYTEKLYQNYNDLAQKLDSNDQHGLYTARDFSAGVTFSTRIYGMKLFKKGSLRGIRHVLTPNIGLSYHPDFGSSPFNYYYRARVDSSQTLVYQSPFANSIVGVPPLGRAGLVNFGLNNNLQIKVKSSKDTVSGFKNVTLIDALGANLSYNPAADSFQWSAIALNFRTNVLDKINISSAASFDPYAFNYATGQRMNVLSEETGGSLARFTTASLALGTNFHSKPKTGAPNPTNSEEYGRVMRNAGYNDYVDMNIPWSLNVSYALSANKNYSYYSLKDTLVLSQTLTMQGELQITTRWKVTVSTGYNFDYKQLTLTTIDVYRDLHCWAMHLQTIPFGPRKSFNFTLNVKAAALQDLKLMRRRDYRDSPI